MYGAIFQYLSSASKQVIYQETSPLTAALHLCWATHRWGVPEDNPQIWYVPFLYTGIVRSTPFGGLCAPLHTIFACFIAVSARIFYLFAFCVRSTRTVHTFEKGRNFAFFVVKKGRQRIGCCTVHKLCIPY